MAGRSIVHYQNWKEQITSVVHRDWGIPVKATIGSVAILVFINFISGFRLLAVEAILLKGGNQSAHFTQYARIRFTSLIITDI